MLSEKIKTVTCCFLSFEGEKPANIVPVVLSKGGEPSTTAKLHSLGFPSLNVADLTYKEGSMSGSASQGHWLVDMALNKGDSGSPVFNSSGQVVAVVRGGFEGIEGLKGSCSCFFCSWVVGRCAL